MNFCNLGLSVIETEAQAVFELTQRIDQNFQKACELLLSCKGRIVVIGMGKSGHIAGKIAATLSSTGSPAFFVHPGEACHGDLGMIIASDVVLALSYSGNTEEVIALIPTLKRIKVPLLAMTGNPESTLAKAADVHINIGIKQEACPLGLAPTTSTTVSLVMGDALAIALLQARGFSEEDFALSHPGGSLGKRLLLRVDDLWHVGEEVPVVNEYATISEALIEVTEKKLGMTCVVDNRGLLTGVYTDGDIRRTLSNRMDINTTLMGDVIHEGCYTVEKGTLAVDALSFMHEKRITTLVIPDEEKRPYAVVHVHDILNAGLY